MKKMRKGYEFAFVLGLVVIIIFVSAVQAQAVVGGTNLQVRLAKYDPIPAEAGKIMTVWFDVRNKGTDVAKNATFTIKEQYPFYAPTGGTLNYGNIRGSDDIRIEFKVLVDKTAPKGIAELKLVYTPDGNAFAEKDFNITIEKAKNETDLKSLFVKMDPVAYPGGTSTLTVDVTNVADGTAYYLVASASTDIANIERSDVFVGTLIPDEFESVDYKMRFKQDIEPGNYPVNIKLVYKSSDSEEITENDVVYVRLVSAKEAQLAQNNQTPWFYYIIGTIVVIVLVRVLAHPFYKWFVKPLKRKEKKKGEAEL
jgi:hypothetical protein